MEKLPYLQQLGINAIELLPVHEFNELEYYQARPAPASPSGRRQPAALPSGGRAQHRAHVQTRGHNCALKCTALCACSARPPCID